MQLDTDRLQNQLILEEGLRLMAYDDETGYPVPPGGRCVGNLTVGVGHNLDANPLTPSEKAVVGHDGRTKPITHDNALMILDEDIADACGQLDAHLPWWEGLDEIRARVMVDLTFAMGIGGLMGFHTFLGLMKAGEFDTAANDLLATKWYGEARTRGVRLVGMVRTGEDYTV